MGGAGGDEEKAPKKEPLLRERRQGSWECWQVTGKPEKNGSDKIVRGETGALASALLGRSQRWRTLNPRQPGCQTPPLCKFPRRAGRPSCGLGWRHAAAVPLDCADGGLADCVEQPKNYLTRSAFQRFTLTRVSPSTQSNVFQATE